MYDATYRVILFGDEGVGKRTLCQKYSLNFFNLDTTMTSGIEFFAKSFQINDKKIKMQIFLLSSEERFKYAIPTYVRGVNGALFLYDVTNYSSLKHLDEWLKLINKDVKSEDKFPNIVVGNKADLIEKREVKGDIGIEFTKSRGVDGFIECSAKTGEKVVEAFRAFATLMLTRSRLM